MNEEKFKERLMEASLNLINDILGKFSEPAALTIISSALYIFLKKNIKEEEDVKAILEAILQGYRELE